jgi:hypothetical protein
MKQPMTASSLFFLTVSGIIGSLVGCSPEQTYSAPPVSTAPAQGGTSAADSSTGGQGSPSAGGTSASSSSAPSQGGNVATGGAGSVGGVTGNNATGGSDATGGKTGATGGKTGATGGKTGATGGKTSATGGKTSATGGAATGGDGSVTDTGGNAGTGGATAAVTTASATTCTFDSSGTLAVTSKYVAAGTCGGYAYTYANGTATIAPACTSTGCTPELDAAKICASGEVPPSATYANTAGIGFSIFQSRTGDPTPLKLTGTNLVVNITNNATSSTLRVQLTQDTTGTLDAFCYDISGKTGAITIPLSSFNTKCYDSPPDGTALTAAKGVYAIEINAPCAAATTTNTYDFCVNSVTMK